MQRYIFLFLVYTVFVFCTAQSQDNYERVRNMTMEELMQIPINVSTSIPKEIFSTPSVVSVIDKDMILNYHFESIADAIRAIAGVDITQTNNDRNVETFRGILQNYYSNKTLLLINNTPTWQTIYGNHILNRINIRDVERIEILKGPASVLYGTNAYSGVINIITKSPKHSQASGQIRLGYPGLYSTSITSTQYIGDFSAHISVSNLQEERNPYNLVVAPDSIVLSQDILLNYDSIVNYQENLEESTAEIQLKYKEHSLFINTFNNKHAYMGGYFSYSSGMPGYFADKGLLAAYRIQNMKIYEDLSLDFNLYYDYFQRDYPINYLHTEEVNIFDKKFGSKLNANYRLTNALNFEVGADFVKGIDYNHTISSIPNESVVRENLKGEEKIFEYSAFVQGNLKIDFFSIILGTRYTGNDIFESNISSRATANFQLNKNNALKLIYGESFRTPNMLELYFQHPSVVGNPKLKPETSVSYEIAYITQIENFFAQATAYYSYYNDLIQRVSYSREKPSEYRNVGEFAGYGIELELKYINHKIISAFLNYNIINGEDKDEAYSNYRFVPKHTLSAGVSKELGNFNLALDSYLYSKTYGILADIPMQFTLNIHVSYHHDLSHKLGLNHTLSVTNINNSDMLIPEYIRARENINQIPTTAFGSRIIYSLCLDL